MDDYERDAAIVHLLAEVRDLRHRLGILENLQSLAERAIRAIQGRLLWVDVNQAVEEFDEGIPEEKKH